MCPARHPIPPGTPGGHSFGKPALSLPDLNHEDWRKSEEYLYSIDLFNGEYWWECHEVLEELRHARWSESRTLGLDLEAMVRDTRSFLTVEEAGPARLVLEF